MPDASFGDQVDWSSAKRVNKRSYSIEASGAKSKLIITYLHVKTGTSIKINSEGKIYDKIF